MALTLAKNIQIRLLPPFKGLRRCIFSGKPSFEEHQVSIKTCGSLYKKWSKERKFRTLPNDDLNFNIKYFDNSSVLKEKKPIIVAIHGAPGSYKDFSGLSSYFEQKARVIVPNFPDFTHYKPGIFRFSDEEKAQFTKDFLAAISVSQIDALIVHSSGIYPGLHLCLDNDILIKSVIILNPGTFTYDMKVLNHIKVMQRIVAASENPVFMKLLECLGPLLLKVGRIPVRNDSFLDPLLSATTMVHSNFSEGKAKFLHLYQKKFPILCAFSLDDKLIGEKCSYDLAYLLGLSKKEIFAYDKDGILVNEGKYSDILKVISFEKGSHYVFWKHADIIHKEIRDFLRRNMIDV